MVQKCSSAKHISNFTIFLRISYFFFTLVSYMLSSSWNLYIFIRPPHIDMVTYKKTTQQFFFRHNFILFSENLFLLFLVSFLLHIVIPKNWSCCGINSCISARILFSSCESFVMLHNSSWLKSGVICLHNSIWLITLPRFDGPARLSES